MLALLIYLNNIFKYWHIKQGNFFYNLENIYIMFYIENIYIYQTLKR